MPFVPPPALVRHVAARLDVEPAAVHALAVVEAGPTGPFLADGSPACLFERHQFSRLTDRRFDVGYPDLSSRTSGGYGKYSAQPGRVLRASLLDREAAFAATSWGLWQVMGFNAARLGYQRVSSYSSPAEDLARSCFTLDGQAEALRRFVAEDPELVDALRARDWKTAAKIYNGPGYAKHEAGPYDVRLAAAYAAAVPIYREG